MYLGIFMTLWSPIIKNPIFKKKFRLRILDGEVILSYYGWFLTGEAGRQEWQGWRQGHHAAGSEDGGGTRGPRAQVVSRSKERQGHVPTLGPPEGAQPADALTLAQGDPFWLLALGNDASLLDGIHVLICGGKINIPWKENSAKRFSSKHTMWISSSRPFPMLIPLPYNAYHFLLSTLAIATQNKDEECITHSPHSRGLIRESFQEIPRLSSRLHLKYLSMTSRSELIKDTGDYEVLVDLQRFHNSHSNYPSWMIVS